MSLTDLSSEFPHIPDLIYLNHAAVGPWPKRTAAAVRSFADENNVRGAQLYPEWMRVEATLRRQLADLIGARSSDEVALVKNTSEGLSIIAYGLRWQKGDNIVIPAQEFPSNRIVWESLQHLGVEVRKVEVKGYDDPEDRLIQRMDWRTRLMSVSSVQYDTGLSLDLTRLGRACEAAEVLFCIDAIQSLGVLDMDVRKYRADFVVSDGHKWLLSPEGLALFYCRRELQESLELRQFGWHMVEDLGAFDSPNWRPADTARRFECGSPNMLGIHAMSASLSLFEEFGIPYCNARIMDNTSFLIAALLELSDKYELMTPKDRSRQAGIVSFRPRHSDTEKLYKNLMETQIVCALRSGCIRFSPHFYTPRPLLYRAISVLEAL